MLMQVDVGRVEVVDGDEPPVVLVAQIGTGGASWRPVMKHLHSGPEIISYDRPATGDGPPRPAPNPPLPYSSFAAELTAILDELGVTQPVALVGHSFGSLIVRAFAGRHPGRAAGMVHVDGSVPRLALWPDELPIFDGDGPGAAEIDTVAGAAEMSGISLPAVPTIVVGAFRLE
jgi:pimeloyl-ACP methyl ester carboxylesterase